MSNAKDFIVVQEDNKVKLYEVVEAEGPTGNKVKIRRLIGKQSPLELIRDLAAQRKNIVDQRERDDLALERIAIIEKKIKPFVKKEEAANKKKEGVKKKK